ncbi:helix-turn-helix domain-containing protein [Photobacterium atrarenae]|uniref:Helix-turn-helix domain-containing protein n=1 Tax=Photobacterium atrarenae TaxID=865757 RepID=A0ABY5GC46_9GAMM|nr:helix-turn-helix domain-containing protein [Photobacterium atrarenae]UTV26411.1 helix-turn-helix domain-containing protein [Photobacterium atrarenae]
MSVRIMSKVWDDPTFRGSTKLIMLCLADFANDEGCCWPSMNRIAQKCGVSISTLKSQLNKLCDSGHIRKETRKKVTSSGEITNDTNLYWIVTESLGGPESDPGQNSPRPKSDPGQNSAPGRPKSGPKPSLDPSISHSNTPVVPKTAEAKTRKADRKPKKRAGTLPGDFTITDDMADWYARQSEFIIDINEATDRWKDAMLSKQIKYVDWSAAWRNGMRNANKWALERESRPQGRVNSFAGQNYSAPEGFRS